MKYKILILALALPMATRAQQITIGYAATSVKAWGSMQNSRMSDMRVGKAGMIFIYQPRPFYDVFGTWTEQKLIGLYYTPLVLNYKIVEARLGAVVFNKKAPNRYGRHLNVYFSAGFSIPVKKITIGFQYTHISNAWTGEMNPGYDFPTLTTGFNF